MKKQLLLYIILLIAPNCFTQNKIIDSLKLDVENGELPNDIVWLGKLVQDICYYNAKNYFGM